MLHNLKLRNEEWKKPIETTGNIGSNRIGFLLGIQDYYKGI